MSKSRNYKKNVFPKLLKSPRLKKSLKLQASWKVVWKHIFGEQFVRCSSFESTAIINQTLLQIDLFDHFSNFRSSKIVNASRKNTGPNACKLNSEIVTVNRHTLRRNQPTRYQQMSHSKHITALKTFVAITLCFIVVYGSVFLILLRITDNSIVVYVPIINYINNPFIYMTFNKAFRKDMIKMLRNLCNRC